MFGRICASAALLVLTVLVHAQDAVAKIQALDKVNIACVEERLLSKTYKVSKDGVILMDFLGAVEVLGLTETEAADKISKKLVSDRILRKATIEVQRVKPEGETTPVKTDPTPTEPTPKDPVQKETPPVTVAVVKYSGAIKNPGEMVFREGLKFSELLAAAGPNETTDLESITIKSADGTIKKVSATNLNDGLALRAGDDIVFSPKPVPTTFEVFVSGGVTKPGSLTLPLQTTVRNAIEAAGGFVGTAAKDKVRIERDGQIIQTLDLTQPSTDFALAANDRVVVDLIEKRAYVQVDGAVANPGYFVVTPGMKLGEAISAAGGYSTKAKLDKVEILSAGESKPRIVNFKEIEQGYSGDIVLKAGDVVKVPSSKARNNTPVKVVAGVAAYLLIFRR